MNDENHQVVGDKGRLINVGHIEGRNVSEESSFNVKNEFTFFRARGVELGHLVHVIKVVDEAQDPKK